MNFVLINLLIENSSHLLIFGSSKEKSYNSPVNTNVFFGKTTGKLYFGKKIDIMVYKQNLKKYISIRDLHKISRGVKGCRKWFSC